MTLRAARCDQGKPGGSSHVDRSHGRMAAPVLVATLVIVLTLISGAPSAFASGRPFLQYLATQAYEGAGFVSSTRMLSEANLNSDELETKWRAEYSTSKSALESGSGTLAGSGAQTALGFSGEVKEPAIGFGVPTDVKLGSGDEVELHHLVPGTHYYAQFVAENSGGKTTLPFEFTTLPIGKPEIAKIKPAYLGDDYTSFGVSATSPTTAGFDADLETNGASTTYSFGYSTSPTGTITECASGMVTAAEDYAELDNVPCAGLTPETTYYVHLIATNEKGTITETVFHPPSSGNVETVASSFTTPTAKPIVSTPELRNATALSAHVSGNFLPHHEETHWRFETATSLLGPWSAVPGAAGTVSLAEAEALPESDGASVGATLTGLTPASKYYVRLFAENAAGEAENAFGEPVSSESRGLGSFETTSPPTANTLAVHAVHGEALRMIGTVDPNSRLTSDEQTVTLGGAPTGGTFVLTFAGQTTAPIAYDAPAHGPGSIEEALEALSTIGSGTSNVTVSGPDGGPYTIYMGREDEEDPVGEKAEPEIEANASGLSPAGTVTIAVTQPGGLGYDAHYHFQYVGEEQFNKEGEWSKAVSTPEVDIGSGIEAKFVAADLQGLKAGETYRYRIVATSDFPGNPVVDGSERTLTVPAALASEASASCANEALRTGPSAKLPDCRAYEQLSPVDKGGAREPFTYGFAIAAGFMASEDGEHGMLDAESDWGSGPTAGQAPYFFSHEVGGWRMTAGAIQPETGVNKFSPELFSADLTSVAFASQFGTSPDNKSSEIEYKSGLGGGPYVTRASVPVKQQAGGWVGASRDFSRLFLSVADNSFLGSSTGTRQGADDLYEYAGGETRQVNVIGNTPGSTIGSCGASIVKGQEGAGLISSAHAVSSDGSRVFFEATPSSDCTEPKHLYMRVNGESTVDLGAYRFLAANVEGTKVLLEKLSGETSEIFLYETASATLSSLFTIHKGGEDIQNAERFLVSEDLSTIYFMSPEQLTAEAPAEGQALGKASEFLYRYDVETKELSFLDSTSQGTLVQISPDGRDLYFTAEIVGGVPGGAPASGNHGEKAQVYRYDSDEALVQCVSCASSFDSEPKLPSLFDATGGLGGVFASTTGYPRTDIASDNGDYVFFDTPSALLPSDVDGEVEPENSAGAVQPENGSAFFSVSSDVYEWRKPGVDGCTHVQGCLALITNGRGGYLNLFLGTDESGRDAFIYTNSELGPQDNDAAGDIYDARIGGGTAPVPPSPVECEGDACSTPANQPNDATPSSSTFSGAGNLAQPLPVKTSAKRAKAKTKKKKRVAGKKHKQRKGKRNVKQLAKGRKS